MEQFALLKFFSTPEYKEDFLNGTVYCKSAEYFRKNTLKGIGDSSEHAIDSYYKGKEDKEKPIIEFREKKDGEVICRLSESINTALFYKNGEHDSWINCWFFINVDDSKSTIINDIKKMVRDFGGKQINAILIEPNNVNELIKRFKENSPEAMTHGRVKYTSDILSLGDRFTKSDEYQYQNEYRFSFGNIQKNQNHSESYAFHVDTGFRDLAITSFWLKMNYKNENNVDDEYIQFFS